MVNNGWLIHRYGNFHKWGSPKWLVYKGTSHQKGCSRGTPISGNHHFFSGIIGDDYTTPVFSRDYKTQGESRKKPTRIQWLDRGVVEILLQGVPPSSAHFLTFSSSKKRPYVPSSKHTKSY